MGDGNSYLLTPNAAINPPRLVLQKAKMSVALSTMFLVVSLSGPHMLSCLGLRPFLHRFLTNSIITSEDKDLQSIKRADGRIDMFPFNSRTPRLIGFITFLLVTTSLVKGTPAPPTNTTVGPEIGSLEIHCERTDWYDVCWFFFANYILHALSVPALPGEKFYSSLVFKFCCFLLPYTGIRRGLGLILRASNLSSNDLQRAARAQALCMVIRTSDWRPQNGETINGCQIDLTRTDDNPTLTSNSEPLNGYRLEKATTTNSEKALRPETTLGPEKTAGNDTPMQSKPLKIQIRDPYTRRPVTGLIGRLAQILIESDNFKSSTPSKSVIDYKNVKIQGLCELVPGYALSCVPADVKLYLRNSGSAAVPSTISDGIKRSGDMRVACAHDFPRLLFSLTQTLSGGFALYKAKGSQVERYGFAAFGFTVIPYIAVSIINFLGTLLTSEYETVFLVHSSIMDEMVARGGLVDGVVGTLEAPIDNDFQMFGSRGEERVEIPDSPLRFRSSDDFLRCEDPAIHPSSGCNYIILPPEGEQPKTEELNVLRFPILLERLRNKLYRKAPKKLPLDPLLIIPSHSSVTLLPQSSLQVYRDFFCITLLIIAVLAPHAIILILSGYKSNHSTNLQRTLVLQWLINGQITGYFLDSMGQVAARANSLQTSLIVLVAYGSSCVGGLVVVAQEMIEFGTCKAT